MEIYKDERLALFIDGASLNATTRSLDIDIDFRRLLAYFQRRARLVRALYYTALIEDSESSSLRPLIDWLQYNGYTTVTKPIKTFHDEGGQRRFKGSMGVELAIDALRLAPQLDHIILFTGDGDYKSLVGSLQQMGKRVSVISTLETRPPMVADELRRQADQFVDLADLENEISRATHKRNSDEPENCT